jgi:hypothetical protein
MKIVNCYFFSNATSCTYQLGQGMDRDETSTCRNTGSIGELFVLLSIQSKAMNRNVEKEKNWSLCYKNNEDL